MYVNNYIIQCVKLGLLLLNQLSLSHCCTTELKIPIRISATALSDMEGETKPTKSDVGGVRRVAAPAQKPMRTYRRKLKTDLTEKFSRISCTTPSSHPGMTHAPTALSEALKVRSYQTRMKRYARMIYMLSQCKDTIDNPAALFAWMRRRE